MGWSRRRFVAVTGAVAGALAVGGLAACSSDDDDGSGEGGGGGGDGGSGGGGGGSALPAQATMVGWISDIVDQGIRRPGYEADQWVEGFIADQFREFGLDDVRLEPVTAKRWEPVEWTLTVTAGDETREVDCFPVPYAAPVDDLDVELALFDEANPGAVADRAALCEVSLIELPADLMSTFGTVPDDMSRRVYDPDGSFEGATHLTPSTTGATSVEAADAGATAFVGTLKDYPGDTCQFYVPYTAEDTPIPGVYVNGSDGEWMRQQLEGGPVRVRLQVETTLEEVETNNVVGELAGADDEVVIVGSHHDGPWASAVEDGSGIAMVLAQAHYWAAQDEADRPHRMVFVLHAGHMAGWVGQKAFVEDQPDLMARTVLEVHLEHAAAEFVEQDGELEATGQCVPRWWFTSRNPELEEAVYAAFEAEDLKRSMLVAPDALDGRPPTDGVAYYDEGVPIVNLLGAPWFLFDERDTLDKVDQDNLEAIARTVVRIIESTADTSAAQMRQGVTAALPAGDPE
jgi:peptidase M28-like protein